MSAYIFEMDSLAFDMFLKTGAISVASAMMQKWMPKIRCEDDVYIHNRDERKVYGIFRAVTSVPKMYYNFLKNSQNHHLWCLYSSRIIFASTDEDFQSGPIEPRKISNLKFVQNDTVNPVSDYKTITGNTELDGIIWGSGKLDERNIVRFPLIDLPTSISEHFIDLIKGSKVKHKIYKDNTRVNLYGLEIPPQFELNKGVLRKIQNRKFMEAYLISKIKSVDFMYRCTGDAPLEYTFRWMFKIENENEGLKKYLEESGIIVIEDKRAIAYFVSPLSFNKRPISYFIEQFRKDVINLEETEGEREETPRDDNDLMWDLKHKIISDLFIKLFEFHGYSTHSEFSERATILGMFSDRRIIKVAIMDKKYLHRPNGFTEGDDERIIVYGGSTIESASYKDAFPPNGRSLFENIANDAILNLNRDFSSIFFTYIANILKI